MHWRERSTTPVGTERAPWFYAAWGKSFCSGFDLNEIESLPDADVATRVLDIERMLQALYHAPLVTVALVHSMAFGAGADLVCCCHRRIATRESRFCMPGLNFGILLGTRRLKQRIGVDNAVSVLTNTRVFDAPEALDMGYLTEIAPVENWPEHIEAAKRAGESLPTEYFGNMLNVVIPDTRQADLADLEESVRTPGLVERILEYPRSNAITLGQEERIKDEFRVPILALCRSPSRHAVSVDSDIVVYRNFFNGAAPKSPD